MCIGGDQWLLVFMASPSRSTECMVILCIACSADLRLCSSSYTCAWMLHVLYTMTGCALRKWSQCTHSLCAHSTSCAHACSNKRAVWELFLHSCTTFQPIKFHTMPDLAQKKRYCTGHVNQPISEFKFSNVFSIRLAPKYQLRKWFGDKYRQIIYTVHRQCTK